MENWQTIALTAFLTTVGTALVTYFGHRWTTGRDNDADRDRMARYLAIRVVCCLDEFVTGCVDVASDDGRYDADATRRTGVSSPVLALPDDVDWKATEADLMYSTLSFPNQVKAAEAAVAFVGSELASPPDYEEFFEERTLRYSKLGIEANYLAKQFRDRYKIPHRDVTAWDPEASLMHLLSGVRSS